MKQKFTKLFLVLLVVLTHLTFFGRAEDETELTNTTSPEVSSETPTHPTENTSELTDDNDTTKNHLINVLQDGLLEMFDELIKSSSKSELVEERKKLQKMIEKLDGLLNNTESNDTNPQPTKSTTTSEDNEQSNDDAPPTTSTTPTTTTTTSTSPTTTTTTSTSTSPTTSTAPTTTMSEQPSVKNDSLNIDSDLQPSMSGDQAPNGGEKVEATSSGRSEPKLSSKNEKKRFYQSTPFLFFLFFSIILMLAFYFGYVSRRKVSHPIICIRNRELHSF